MVLVWIKANASLVFRENLIKYRPPKVYDYPLFNSFILPSSCYYRMDKMLCNILFPIFFSLMLMASCGEIDKP